MLRLLHRSHHHLPAQPKAVSDELVEPLLGTDDLCTEQMHDTKLNE